ncbi:hypothetical protein [Streptomyces sp. TRM68416]|uniref:hypothetical protein n=1 Tax=Streptomyces sp. TRM68416 TaxID=2758412 RepID=UPI0016620D37|nr:hypothetical protein [Streptomyces sp. TRM68416]MBD0838347.1 hypothetical protein [Streptomyces sp. TRM68416]
MSRGTTARTVLSVLAAVLFALPFLAPTASFAQAHTASDALAKAQPGIKPSQKAPAEGILSFGHCDPVGGPTDPLRPRARLAHTVDSGPQTPERPLTARGPAAEHEPVAPAADHRTSRPPTAHTPAVLQVFRC